MGAFLLFRGSIRSRQNCRIVQMSFRPRAGSVAAGLRCCVSQWAPRTRCLLAYKRRGCFAPLQFYRRAVSIRAAAQPTTARSAYVSETRRFGPAAGSEALAGNVRRQVCYRRAQRRSNVYASSRRGRTRAVGRARAIRVTRDGGAYISRCRALLEGDIGNNGYFVRRSSGSFGARFAIGARGGEVTHMGRLDGSVGCAGS